MNFNLRIILHVCFIFILYFYLYSALIWIHDYALNKNRCYYYNLEDVYSAQGGEGRPAIHPPERVSCHPS